MLFIYIRLYEYKDFVALICIVCHFAEVGSNSSVKHNNMNNGSRGYYSQCEGILMTTNQSSTVIDLTDDDPVNNGPQKSTIEDDFDRKHSTPLTVDLNPEIINLDDGR